MLALTRRIAFLFCSFAFLQGTPTSTAVPQPTPTPLPVTIVSSRSFWPETFAEWAGILSALAIIAGGIWALRTYFEGLRLKAAEILMSMEQEFRVVMPTFELIENPGVYSAQIEPLLKEVMKGSNLSAAQLKLLGELDRCLRLLFICSILNKDLGAEQNALIRAYCYYAGVLAEITDPKLEDNPKKDLLDYLQKFYPRLCQWIEDNRKPLLIYRGGGPWKPRPFWKFW